MSQNYVNQNHVNQNPLDRPRPEPRRAATSALHWRRLPLDEVDWARLDAFADRSIFQTQAWLRSVADTQRGEIIIAELSDGQQPLGYFSGLRVRRWGVPILGSPFPGWTTGYMGFNLEPGVDRAKALAALEPFAFRDLSCAHLELLDEHLPRAAGLDLGFAVRPFATYRTDLTVPEEALLARMRKTCRNRVRYARKAGVVIEEAGPDGFAEEYYAQLLEVFDKQGLRPTYGVERVHSLIHHLHPTGHLLLLRARNPDGESVATGLYPGFNTFSFFWGNASRREHLSLSPNELLHWTALRHWKARGVTWHDWGGGGAYKEKYGPEPFTVPHFYKSRHAFIGLGHRLAYRAYYAPRDLKRKWNKLTRLPKVSESS